MTPTGPNANDSQTERLLTEFTGRDDGWRWYVVNDNVMGGRSEGDFETRAGELLFSGATNTNGGGFSSIRVDTRPLDLAGFDGIRLHVRGDGRHYSWRLASGARWRGRSIAHWASFDTTDGQWTTVDLPFDRFVPRFRGTELDGPNLVAGQIDGMGLMINDGRDGAFSIRLDRVAAYRSADPFSLSDLAWEHRVLVVNAARPEDAQRQLDAIASSRSDFEERDLMLVVLLDDGRSAAGERTLTRDEVAGIRSKLDLSHDEFGVRLIGKDGMVKLASDDLVDPANVYDLIDTMPMRRREMSQ